MKLSGSGQFFANSSLSLERAISYRSNDEAVEPPPVSVASGYEVFLKPMG